MSSLLNLLKFKSKKARSHSFLVDFQHIYVRNVILFCTGLSVARHLFWETIRCENSASSLSQSFVDTKCFINGTVSKPFAEEPLTLHHSYYQWVSIYLLLLAVAFYVPSLAWSASGAENYVRLLENLCDKHPEKAIRVVRESKGESLFLKMWMLELIYTVKLPVILYWTDVLFNRYWSLLRWSWKAIDYIFPDSGKCFFTYDHFSGQNEAKLLCILPLCSVYRKIFSFLYVLTPCLGLMDCLAMIYRVGLLTCKRRCINAWWSLKMMEAYSLSWDSKKKFRDALRELDYKHLRKKRESLV